jgi:DNA-binding CsgD family transcriptional regulator
MNKRHHYNLVVFFFFISSAILNGVYFSHSGDMTILALRLKENLVLAIPFLLLYILKYKEIEIEIGTMLIGWSCYLSWTGSVYILGLSGLLSIGVMLILKRTKLKTIPVSLLSVFIFTFHVSSMIRNEETILELAKGVMVVSIMCYTLGVIYYSQYKEPFKPKRRYNLTQQEERIVFSLMTDDPSNKRIARDLHMSEENVKRLLGSIYTKMNIKRGGNRKTELGIKLARHGL